MDQHRETYKEEARELLAELEVSLLELEENPEDEELIGSIFRAMHTIKGSGAMFGFDDIAAFTHEIETVFDLVRDGKMAVTKKLIDLTLEARDYIIKMVEEDAKDEEKGDLMIELFRALIPSEGISSETSSTYVGSKSTSHALQDKKKHGSKIYRIRFRPNHEIFSTGTNPILLLNELRNLGECHVLARTDAVPVLKDLDAEKCYLYWDIVLKTAGGINSIKDVFIFVEDECDLTIDEIETKGGVEEEYKKLGEILVEKGDLTSEDLQKILASRKYIGEILSESGAVEQAAVESALVEQQEVRRLLKKQNEATAASSIRVAAEKLDTLVDLVGELVTVQASLSQKASFQDDSELVSIAEEVERLTADLRDNTMNIRMLPIGTTFSKFKRLVRDLSGELGKEIILTTEGGDTELDKTVIERLNDPLVHIIRNSIDHGIEAPEARKAAGKSRKGTVCLAARHSGANVLIEISDDGAGLDPEAIKAKAIKKGLIGPGEELTENELFSQIFIPGFSTVKEVTDVSGRGVGMDVVKRSIELLRGSIKITSEKGTGTKITLKLPLTLAIIDGLLVEIGQEKFVIPLSVVEECIELNGGDVAGSDGRHIANVRGEMVPYIILRDLFKIEGKSPDIKQIAITEVDGGRVGLLVDQVIGEHQTVIKGLGKVYKDASEFSGATILANGTVTLILDVHRILETSEQEERRNWMTVRQ
jgi:two-component system, chemotaxis family, sensor kinase CheA